MKRKYLSPQTAIIRVKPQSILTGSDISKTQGVDGLGYGGDTSSDNITSGNARQGSLWNGIDDEY